MGLWIRKDTEWSIQMDLCMRAAKKRETRKDARWVTMFRRVLTNGLHSILLWFPEC